MLWTLIIGLIAQLITYNFIILKNDYINTLKIFVYASFTGVISLLLIGWETLLTGRFLFTSKLNFLGASTPADANYTGFIASVAAIIAVFLWLKKDKFKVLVFGGLLSLIVILTGSRKALGTLVAANTMLVYSMYPSKKLRNLIFIILFVLFFYLLIMEIPMFYNVLGSRLESAFEFFTTGETNEASISTRNRLIDNGVLLFSLQPINGYGLDAYRYLEYGKYSHNNFIEMLVSGGLIGTILYYFAYLYTLVSLLITRMKEKVFEHKLILNMLLLLLILLIIIEYWQVTYFERMYGLVLIFSISFIKILKMNNKNVNSKEKNS